MGPKRRQKLSDQVARLEITPEILRRIADLDQFKGAWSAIGRLAPERLASLRKVATIESVGSSTRIEGARLSDREVERLLSRIEVQPFASRDEEEVAGYASVMDTVFESAEFIELSENNIRQLHRDLLRPSEKDTRHRGEYKSLPNHVEAFDAQGKSLGVVFETATPFETKTCMEELILWASEANRSQTLHPLLVTAIFTVKFLAIHPFQDGNGRLSRVLTSLQLLRAGYSYTPYSSLESVIEESKEDYYLALRRTQATLREPEPDWSSWTLYFLRALQRQKDRLAHKLETERAVYGALPELSVNIIALVREHGRVTVADAARETGSNRNTIKYHITALVRDGQLVRHGAGRGTWYAAR